MASQQPKSRQSLRLVGFLMLAVAFGLFVLPRIFPGKSPLVGKPAPDFALDVIHGGSPGDRVRLADSKGHPVLIDFWASWCEACRVEAPSLDAIGRRYGARGLVVVGVATSDQPGAAAHFATSHRLSYPIVYDADDRTATLYGVSSLPTLVVVDANGNVVHVSTGYESERALDNLVAPLL
jgi:cytochrome c biogenesis protein CcmG, thiol:disulfide interchange protein DsbE